MNLYDLIRDNNFDKLKTFIESNDVRGIAHIFFDFFEEDEEVMNLADDKKITVSFLNPILLAIKYRAKNCLQYLVKEFGVRQSLRPLDFVVRTEYAEHPFNTLIVPILLKIKDAELLTFLLKQEGFSFTTQDMNSFVEYAFNDRWLAGLKSFYTSPTTHHIFSMMKVPDQRSFVEKTIRYIADLEDAKTRKTYSIGIFEETLTKQPYAEHVTMALLENAVPKEIFDLVKIARECLKNITSEDLWEMYKINGEAMAEYERRYNNINGVNVENELAKIMMRYANEGRPEQLGYVSQESRKQVRFDEREGSQQDNSQIGQQQQQYLKKRIEFD